VDTLSYKTESSKPATIKKEWLVIDATDKILGRLSTEVAKLLRGKHKPNYTPHMDCGDNIIIINAEKVKLTGKKWNDRIFFYYSGYPGGQKEINPATLFAKSPQRLVEKTIKGMLPKTKLGRQLFRNLHVYTGSEHKHEAQKPKLLDLNTIK
jgi:large subunit ribosomal protein L13